MLISYLLLLFQLLLRPILFPLQLTYIYPSLSSPSVIFAIYCTLGAVFVLTLKILMMKQANGALVLINV